MSFQIEFTKFYKWKFKESPGPGDPRYQSLLIKMLIKTEKFNVLNFKNGYLTYTVCCVFFSVLQRRIFHLITETKPKGFCNAVFVYNGM